MSSGRVTASGWCTTTMRHCAGARLLEAPRHALDLRGATARRRRAASGAWCSAPAPAASSFSKLGSSSRAEGRAVARVGPQQARAARLNSGMSWLPGIATHVPARPGARRRHARRELRARGALGDVARQQQHVGPLRARQALQRLRPRAARSVPKCGSETCSSSVMRRPRSARRRRRADAATAARATTRNSSGSGSHMHLAVGGHLDAPRAEGPRRWAHGRARVNAKLTTWSASPSRPKRAAQQQPQHRQRAPPGAARSRPAAPASTACASAKPSCSSCSALLPTNSVGVRTSCSCAMHARCAGAGCGGRAAGWPGPAPKATSRLRPNCCFQPSRSSSSFGYRPRLALTRNTRSLTSPTCTGCACSCSSTCMACAGVGRNAVRAAEVVEGALRQHAEGAAAAEHGLGHGVDGAVAAGGHDDATGLLRALDGLARERTQMSWVVARSAACIRARPRRRPTRWPHAPRAASPAPAPRLKTTISGAAADTAGGAQRTSLGGGFDGMRVLCAWHGQRVDCFANRMLQTRLS